MKLGPALHILALRKLHHQSCSLSPNKSTGNVIIDAVNCRLRAVYRNIHRINEPKYSIVKWDPFQCLLSMSVVEWSDGVGNSSIVVGWLKVRQEFSTKAEQVDIESNSTCLLPARIRNDRRSIIDRRNITELRGVKIRLTFINSVGYNILLNNNALIAF